MAIKFAKPSKAAATKAPTQALSPEVEIKGSVPVETAPETAPAETGPIFHKLEAQQSAALEELNKLAPELAAAKALLKKAGELQKTVMEAGDGFLAEEDLMFESANGDRITLSAKSLGRKIVDMQGLHEKLGDEAFYQNCTFPLGVLDVHVSKVDQTKLKLVSEGRSGSRAMKPLPRAS
ncbi:hypothetical protein [Roseococcus pinisoli]|uniref:Uncharacterized protein n=1 Tax=Roseococcus pinisoli TaxID=2835040 RepID=A0ABS5QFJ8_9PROT|nr:hypothetical protein [Roseococcus pinisoli]MBS7812327.1 hypothetical protein [Roseococcus pinisoli]